ncbi:signal recognition particle-docking protein FtsY [Romboutsia ilealis]|uniref:Signal recognition particle receptor FtsY n=1 Tax=Romboutsia faecis TaxID=2764597 RepID=A0ABR7JME6_9FIRM|nr:signal recognition particle-docking protein FtsY [Romboutsia faecis]MBC5996093.1 signal recognition particle-docking protein FtsY [Romboutsia faecis]MRN23293.1 signal recognition particle-docking protein FtsY [Romboutsia ilealis]
MFKKLFKFNKKNQEENKEDVESALTEEVQENVIEEICDTIKEEAIEEVKEDIQNPGTKEVLEEAKEVIEKSEAREELEEVKDAIEEIEIKSEDKNNGIEEVSNVKEVDFDSIQEETKVQEEIDDKEKKVSLFGRLKQGLTKAKQGITDKIDTVLKSYTKVDEELLEDLEEVLITADVGVNTTMDMIERLRCVIKSKGITDPQDVRVELQTIVEEILTSENSKLDVEHSPTIVLMVGVNGVGKTTTIGKLANRYKSEGKKVLLAAGDTFRAAAIEQLEVWANRCNVDIIKHQEGADPGAVIFDAIKAAKARKVDLLICDTAGRLHNKANLMNELGKVFKIVDREFPEAKREVLLVVDATTGQNAVSQAKTFKEVADITGIVLTKLDGTAKGGVVLAVKSEVDVPVKLIGVGESVEDLQDFDAKAFSDALFGKN